MSEFRDAIALLIHENAQGSVPWVISDSMADAILTMPEMVWLRDLLIDLLNGDFLSAYQIELMGDLPAGVQAWVES